MDGDEKFRAGNSNEWSDGEEEDEYFPKWKTSEAGQPYEQPSLTGDCCLAACKNSCFLLISSSFPIVLLLRLSPHITLIAVSQALNFSTTLLVSTLIPALCSLTPLSLLGPGACVCVCVCADSSACKAAWCSCSTGFVQHQDYMAHVESMFSYVQILDDTWDQAQIFACVCVWMKNHLVVDILKWGRLDLW